MRRSTLHTLPFLTGILVVLTLGGCRAGTPGGQTGTGATMERSSASSQASADMTIELPNVSSDGGEASAAAQGIVLTQQASRKEVRPGGDLTFTITVRNPSDKEYVNLELEDAFPAGKYEVLETRGGSVGADTVTWTIATLSAREIRNIVVQGRASKDLQLGDSIANVVTLRGAGVPATSVSEVKVVEKLPQAGAGGYADPLPPSYVRPYAGD